MMGIWEKVVAGLAITIVVLGLLMALQGQRIKALSGDLADTKLELVQAYSQLDRLNQSHSETMLALEYALDENKKLSNTKAPIKKRIKEAIKDGKVDDAATTAALSDSLWAAYCARDSAGCTSR